MAPHKLASPLPFGLIVSLALAHVAFGGNRFTFTLHAVHLGATPLVVGLLLGLLMVMPMLLAVHIGRWSDRMGYAPLTLFGMGLLLASGLLAAAWPVMPVLFVASVLTGTGYMLAHVAVNNAIGKVTPAGRTTDAFSMMAMAFSISGLVGPLAAGIVIDGLGHRFAFLLLSAATLAALVLFRGAARRHPMPTAPAHAHRDARVLDLLRDKPLRHVFLASGLVAMGWDLFTLLAPLQGVRAGLSATATGIVVGVFGAGTFAIRLLLPRLVQRVGQWGTLSLALLVTAAGYVAFPLLNSFAALVPASFLLGMSLGCGQPVSMALLHLHAPAHRAGEAVGVRSTITSASQTVLPMVFGALGSALGLMPVFWATAALLAAGGAFARRRR